MSSKIGKPTLRFKRLSENAAKPTKGSVHAAGFDLYSAYDCVVPAKGKGLCPTDLQISIPQGCYGRVAPRSGLAVKCKELYRCRSDYRGNVQVVLFNFGDADFNVKRGDRIAQLICEKIEFPELEEEEELDTTERGSNGFGSTERGSNGFGSTGK